MNDSIAIRATRDFPFLGVKTDDIILVEKGTDGLLRSGGLSWSQDSLSREIDNGYWEPVVITDGSELISPEFGLITISVSD